VRNLDVDRRQKSDSPGRCDHMKVWVYRTLKRRRVDFLCGTFRVQGECWRGRPFKKNRLTGEDEKEFSSVQLGMVVVRLVEIRRKVIISTSATRAG
jgi:hypothetical protein